MKKEFCPYCMSPVEPGKPCDACGLTEGSYTPSPHHLPPGTILNDRYLVGRKLGEGGFGITYIGCDTRLELKVAIKEYYPSGGATRDAQVSLDVRNYTGIPGNSYENGKARFLKEARTMAKMTKLPEIVGVRDFFEANNTAYIVMEYIEGTTFKTLVEQRGGKIPPQELLRIIEPLFSALQQMHDFHLIHRDISPDNLMLENGNVRLLDFGCARESSTGNETMTVQLKHGYAPIEQYMYHGQGPWTDVYALCATIYFCLTGKAPPRSLDRLMNDDMLLPRKLGVELTEQQENALLKGLAVKQHQRFRSMRELYAALYAPEPASPPEDSDGEDEENVNPPVDPPEDPKTQDEGPVEIEEIEEGEEVTQPRKKPWLAIGIGSGLTLMAVVGLVVGLAGKPKEVPAGPDALVQTEPAKEIDLGGNVAYLSGPSEQQLRDAMESDSTAVVIQTNGVALSDPLIVSKPLVVEAGAVIQSYNLVEVTAAGCLDVRGNFENYGLVRIRKGGQVRVSRDTEWFGVWTVWTESPEGLLLKNGATAEIYGSSYTQKTLADSDGYLEFDPETLFADAFHVTSEDQLSSIPDDAKAVVIDADMALAPDTRYFDQPLMIASGVTLTAPQSDDEHLCVDNQILYNCGTIEGGINMGTWERSGAGALVNMGTIDGWIHMDGSPSTFLNFGTVRAEGDLSGRQAINLGAMEGTEHLNLNTGFSNLGTVETTHFIDFNAGVMNAGTVRVSGNDRWISIRDEFWGPGRIEAANGGRIENRGNIRLYNDRDSIRSGSLIVDSQSHYDEGGTLLAGPNAQVEMPNKENLRHLIPFAWGDTHEAYRLATSEEELRSLMEDPQCAGIYVYSIFGVNGNLTVTKGLVIPNHARLTLNHCKTLTVEGEDAFIYADGSIELCGADLILRDKANMVCRKLTDLGSLTVTEVSCLTVLDWETLAPRGGVTVEKGSTLHVPNLKVENNDLLIGEYSQLRYKNSLELAGVSASIRRDGDLNGFHHFKLDKASTLENRGFWFLGGEGDRCLDGTVTNYGEAYFGAWNTNIQVKGTLTNLGTLEYEGNLSLHGSGTVRNQGTFRSNIAGVLDEFNGTYSGNKPTVVR